ncbi:DUF6343 family protein [Streptomyces avicenniae]|uniref:DUF6343 family protein n=1 Tax=Streptomyces avicenniae TaxID=500153 RepID=UPI0006992E00|nr:DUF6343 family protein [Streptomyces avicenniae]
MPSSGRHTRTGTEPVTAYSDLRLRWVLSLVFAPLFLLATVFFAIWWGAADSGDSPSPALLGWLTLACAVLTVIAVIDLLVVTRRIRRRRAPSRTPDA